jgi:hypothetical protein
MVVKLVVLAIWKRYKNGTTALPMAALLVWANAPCRQYDPIYGGLTESPVIKLNHTSMPINP